MSFLRYAISCSLIVFLCSLSGCYRLYFKPQDEKNLRRQLHIPDNIELISFDSNPKEAGFFGREGLRIQAIFQFTENQLKDYSAIIEDTETWKPVSFLGYSPDLAETYSPDAFQWSDIPYESWMNTYLKHWEYLPEIQNVRNGKYYCSLIIAKRGKRMVNPNGGYYYRWEYVGLSSKEVSGPTNNVITTFALLDMDSKMLYAFIGFSG